MPDKRLTTSSTVLLPEDLKEWVDKQRTAEQPPLGTSTFIVRELYKAMEESCQKK